MNKDDNTFVKPFADRELWINKKDVLYVEDTMEEDRSSRKIPLPKKMKRCVYFVRYTTQYMKCTFNITESMTNFMKKFV